MSLISVLSPIDTSPIATSAFSLGFNADEERRGLISSTDVEDTFSNNGDTVIEMDLLPPRWADVSDEVNDILLDIARGSAKLDKLHQKHVLPGFDDNRSAEEGEIERLTTEITRGFHECQSKILKVQSMVSGGEASKAEEAMAKNIQISLATKVQEASTSFRKKQSAYLKKLRGLSGMTTPLDRAGSPSQYQDSDPSADISFSQSALQQSATLTSNDAAIMQREREITDIAKGIIELADIFKELQTMVIDQGTLLDRIDYNVERMSVHVKAADKEMTVASGYQRKTTKRKLILLLLLIIVGVIILLAIKPSKQSALPLPDPNTPRPPPIPIKDDPPTPPPSLRSKARRIKERRRVRQRSLGLW
ncbi:t-SNARE affecting a late Golgi compartment protein 2 [Maublancomyces gigas]|uniref:t-SNARE affecting a late Golgi compartment protein 2 n=1 Tax=Discina gigas TaxID=1032678 RepID=A0ABR3GV68_9PEZI